MLEDADAVHPAAHAVTGRETADAGGRAGKDEVARLEREPGGKLRDDFGHAPDHVRDVALLAERAIHFEPDAAAAGMSDVGRARDRRHRRGMIEALGRVPWLSFFLHERLHVAPR